MSFTDCCPEHPEVLRCLATGYPYPPDEPGDYDLYLLPVPWESAEVTGHGS